MLRELTAGEAGLLVMLFPHLAGLALDHVEDLGGGVRIAARTRTAALSCRVCGVVSARVHDRYGAAWPTWPVAGGRCRWCWRFAGSAAAARRVMDGCTWQRMADWICTTYRPVTG